MVDGTEVKQDSPQETGQASAAQSQGTPPRTFSDKEMQKLVSDAKAEAGREKLEAAKLRQSNLEQQLANATSQLADFQKKMDDAELEAARADPQLLTVYQQRQNLRQRELQLQKDKALHEAERSQHAQDIAESKQLKRERQAQEIAVKYGVDAALLVSVTDGTPDKMEQLAKAISKKPPSTDEGFKPDSGGAVGSGMTWGQVQKAYADNPYNPGIRDLYIQMRSQKIR